jgi:hypothetical protein
MATYNSPAIANTQPVAAHGERAAVQFARQVVTTTAALTTVDVLNFFYLPANARVIAAYLVSSDMDTNGTPTLAFNVGDAGSAARYFAASVVGQAGTASTALAQAGLGFITTAKTLITCSPSANAATGVAGTLELGISYVVEDSATS